MQGIIQVSEAGCCVNRIYSILLISIGSTLTRLIPLRPNWLKDERACKPPSVCHRSAVPGGCLARCKAQNELKGHLLCRALYAAAYHSMRCSMGPLNPSSILLRVDDIAA